MLDQIENLKSEQSEKIIEECDFEDNFDDDFDGKKYVTQSMYSPGLRKNESSLGGYQMRLCERTQSNVINP